MRPNTHILATETFVPRERPEVFAFFADPENLERITPPELNFSITSALPLQMAEGVLIDYRLRLFRIAFKWRTQITVWEENARFVDEQVAGPYRMWVHTHSFFDADGGTRVTDEVRYLLPLYPLGEIAYPVVRRQLNRIFAFRKRRLRELLG